MKMFRVECNEIGERRESWQTRTVRSRHHEVVCVIVFAMTLVDEVASVGRFYKHPGRVS